MTHCKNCNKEYNTKDVSRIYGAESRVLSDGFCSAICYTLKGVMGVKTTRDFILERIAEYKTINGFTYGNGIQYVGMNGKALIELDFNTLTDPQLITIFEHIVRLCHKQM